MELMEIREGDRPREEVIQEITGRLPMFRIFIGQSIYGIRRN